MDIFSRKKGLRPDGPEIPYPFPFYKIAVTPIVYPCILRNVVVFIFIEIVTYAVRFYLISFPLFRTEGTWRYQPPGTGNDRIIRNTFCFAYFQPGPRWDHIIIYEQNKFSFHMAAQGEPAEKFEIDIGMYDIYMGE